MVARDLCHQGYRELFVVQDGETAEIHDAVRSSTRRLHAADEVRVETIRADAVVAGIVRAITATGQRVRRRRTCVPRWNRPANFASRWRRLGSKSPLRAAVVGIGIDAPASDKTTPCSGYTVSAEQVADSIRQLINEVQMHRPTPLWLVGTWIDRGSTRSGAEANNRVAEAAKV